ncbi:MAG TPA: APC family permease [Ktedonobacteraceae bacterium]|jgi:amino acid transporter|nr:APC family permease [Ktedonobacteraceae bacterium]
METTSGTGTTPSNNAQVQRLGHRPTLTTWDAIAQSLAIGPIFSSAFVAFLIAGSAGGAAPLSTLIGAIGVLALGWLISLYARRGGGAGAIYDYLRRLSPAFGLFAAGMYFFGALTLDSGGFLVIGLLATQVFASYLNLTVPFWVFSLIALGLIFTLNYLGIRITTRVQLTLSALSVIPLLILAIVIIAHGGDSGNTLQAFNPASVPAVPTSVPAAGIFPGILFAITLFIGFETSASLGEETRDPRRSIPRAVIGTVVITGIFYLLIVYASDIGFGLSNSAKWASDPAPLDTLATRYVGSWLAVLVDIAVLFDALVVMSAFMATTSRGLFALARHQLLPSPLATISARFRTPLGGIIAVSTVALLILIIVASTTGNSPTNVITVFGIMSTIGSLLIELIYVALCFAAVRLVTQDPTKWWRWLFLLVAVVTPILGIYGSVVPFPMWPQNLGIFISLGVIVLSLVWTLVNRFVFPARLGKASEPHPWEVEEVNQEVATAS